MRPVEPIDIMRYYVTYQDIEKKILKNIHDRNPEKRMNAYNVYMHKHMKIGRNFKSKSGEMVLGTVKNMLGEGFVDVEELSKRLVKNELASRPTIINLKVAASKLLWLFLNETIIMDNVNMRVLGVKSYKEYIKNWQIVFQSKDDEIRTVIQENFNGLDDILNQKWFRMRIFDQYLLSLDNS